MLMQTIHSQYQTSSVSSSAQWLVYELCAGESTERKWESHKQLETNQYSDSTVLPAMESENPLLW